MALSALATEAKAIALIAEARRCLALGVAPSNNSYNGGVGGFLKDLIDQLELVTTADQSARVDILPDSNQDGRDAAGKATAGG